MKVVTSKVAAQDSVWVENREYKRGVSVFEATGNTANIGTVNYKVTGQRFQETRENNNLASKKEIWAGDKYLMNLMRI